MSSVHAVGFETSSMEVPACAVCGSTDVRIDTVEQAPQLARAAAEALHLGECGHCEHRWTWRAALPERAAQRLRSAHRSVTRIPEVATAA